jgi:hypothetical protein
MRSAQQLGLRRESAPNGAHHAPASEEGVPQSVAQPSCRPCCVHCFDTRATPARTICTLPHALVSRIFTHTVQTQCRSQLTQLAHFEVNNHPHTNTFKPPRPPTHPPTHPHTRLTRTYIHPTPRRTQATCDAHGRPCPRCTGPSMRALQEPCLLHKSAESPGFFLQCRSRFRHQRLALPKQSRTWLSLRRLERHADRRHCLLVGWVLRPTGHQAEGGRQHRGVRLDQGRLSIASWRLGRSHGS